VLFVSPSGSLVESNRVYPYGEKWMADYGTSNDQKFTTYTRQDDHYTDEVATPWRGTTSTAMVPS